MRDHPHFTIERATLADLATVIDLYEDAARWLVSRGITQWRPGDYTQGRARRNIEQDEVYLARLAGKPIGKLTLMWADPEVWGEQPPDAGYVHGLAVRRSAAGQGLGALLLDQAAQRVAEVGRAYLRLDCMASNKPLRAYYEKLGFAHRGSIYYYHGQWGSSLYEREIRR